MDSLWVVFPARCMISHFTLQSPDLSLSGSRNTHKKKIHTKSFSSRVSAKPNLFPLHVQTVSSPRKHKYTNRSLRRRKAARDPWTSTYDTANMLHTELFRSLETHSQNENEDFGEALKKKQSACMICSKPPNPKTHRQARKSVLSLKKIAQIAAFIRGRKWKN